MKRAVIFSVLLSLFWVFNASALDFKVMDMRDQFVNQSQEIKALMIPKTKDGVLLTAMFDSCLLTATQLDAYFSMVSIFETLTEKDSGASAIKFITAWLDGIKNTGAVNISSLDSARPAEQKTMEQAKKLKIRFASLNKLVEDELRKFGALSISARQQKK